MRHIRIHSKPLGPQTTVRPEHTHSAKHDAFNEFIESQSKHPIPGPSRSVPNKSVRVVTV